MILGCRTEHLKNKTVLVNGNSYRVGDNGVCLDVSDADAAKLLENKRQWYRLGGTTLDAITRELDPNPDTLPVDAAGNLRHLDLPEPVVQSTQPAPITQAAPVAPTQAAQPGSTATPGIAPTEAQPITQDGEMQSFAHNPDGSVEPVKRKRGRPSRKKDL